MIKVFEDDFGHTSRVYFNTSLIASASGGHTVNVDFLTKE